MSAYEINTNQPTPPPAPTSRRRLSAREIGILCLLAVFAIGGALSWFFSREKTPAAAVAPKLPPPDVAPTEQNLIDLVKFAGTSTFASLPAQQQSSYLKLLMNEDRLGDYLGLYLDKKITEEEGRRAMMNIMPAVIQQQSREWMAKGTQEGRDAYIEKTLDDFERMAMKMQAAMMVKGLGSMFSGRSGSGAQGAGDAGTAGSSAQPAGPLGERRQGHWDAAWIKDMIEGTTPGDRTAMGEYVAALRLRARQRFGR